MSVTQSKSASSPVLSAKPDPLVEVSYVPGSRLYTAAILSVAVSAPSAADAIYQLHVLLGWWQPGPVYNSTVRSNHEQ